MDFAFFSTFGSDIAHEPAFFDKGKALEVLKEKMLSQNGTALIREGGMVRTLRAKFEDRDFRSELIEFYSKGLPGQPAGKPAPLKEELETKGLIEFSASKAAPEQVEFIRKYLGDEEASKYQKAFNSLPPCVKVNGDFASFIAEAFECSVNIWPSWDHVDIVINTSGDSDWRKYVPNKNNLAEIEALIPLGLNISASPAMPQCVFH